MVGRFVRVGGFCAQPYILCCVQCNLNLHVECIPALQNTAKVETHRRLLTLTDPLPEDDTNEYYCNVCEKERNPKHSVYYCAKCDFVAHIECGFPDLKVVSPLEEESYEEEEPSVVQQLVDAGLDPFHDYDIEEYCARATNAEGAGDDEVNMLYSQRSPEQEIKSLIRRLKRLLQ
ncbi:unnamed protein product [Camellia sinensis]